MSKRFIDTAIFRKDFVRSLEAPYKLLFIYLISECNHAGIWDKELDIAELRIGVKFDVDPIKKLGGKVVVVDGGKKWFIPSFIDFQYGELNPDNRAHASVISILKPLGLYNPDQNKPLTSPLQGAKDKDKDKDKEIDKDKGAKSENQKFDPLPIIPSSWDKNQFIFYWEKWIAERKKKKKPVHADVLEDRLKELIEVFPDWNRAFKRLKDAAGEGWLRLRFPEDTISTNGKESGKYAHERKQHLEHDPL